MTASLFEAAGLKNDVARPLADRLRPRSLDAVVGQDHLVGSEGFLTRAIASRQIGSLILWGPPGTGKTTVAKLLAGAVGLVFVELSAVFSGVADLKRVFAEARARREAGQGTLLFVDEIHRFNRAQQDSFLPVMEDGTIVLVGATTENPSFALNAALLSRATVLTFNRLDDAALADLLARAEAELPRPLPLTPEAQETLFKLADGDGRALISLADDIARLAPADIEINTERLVDLVQRRAAVYDKAADGHYNFISALHKSVRGSDPQASLYYLCRMLAAGEDPLFLARRLIRMAVEDIGLADPQALVHANAARDAYQMLGSPEGELALAQVTIYLALAPKSNAVYQAFKAATAYAKAAGSPPPPKHILNAPTTLMRREGYGAGYAYDHDSPDAFSGQSYFPEGLERQDFYRPAGRGFEERLKARIEALNALRREREAEPRD